MKLNDFHTHRKDVIGSGVENYANMKTKFNQVKILKFPFQPGLGLDSAPPDMVTCLIRKS